MSNFCPHYPPPSKKRPSAWRMFFSKRRSWLDALYERSYAMKMGEVHLPGVDLYMVNEPSLVRHVLVEAALDEFPKHPMLGEALRPLLGNSILTTNGEVWKRQRELMNPSFEAARVTLVYAQMRDAALAMAARLSRVPQGAIHNVEAEMTHVTADIILRTIMSESLDDTTARQIFKAFESYQALAPRLMMPSFFGLRWLRPWWKIGQSNRAAADIRALLISLIRPRYDAAQRGEAAHDDILSSLLQARDPQTGKGFSFDELVDQTAMLFLAGHETSASALSWALHLIANSPLIQERLHDEAIAQLDLDKSDAGTLKDLTLARNVFREVLRLFPPVGFLARQCTRTQTLRNKTVAAGASVVVAPWLIQRHRSMWARPDEFDPDRYARDDESPSARESSRLAYLPFGMGPRACIGAAFALQEAALVLSVLARQFRFEPVADDIPTPVGRLTIRAERGIRLHVFQRGERS